MRMSRLVLGDKNDANVSALGGVDNGHQLRKIFLVIIVYCKRNELKTLGVRLPEKLQYISETKITPLFPECVFHIDDQRLEILHIPAYGACQNWAWVGLYHVTRHCSPRFLFDDAVNWLSVLKRYKHISSGGIHLCRVRLTPDALLPLE